MEAPHLLAADDLAVDVALLDDQRPLPDMAHLEGHQLLWTTDTGVSDDRNHRCGVEPVLCDELRSKPLDLGRREANHRALALSRRLPDRLDRVRARHPAPEDRV